jgi:hypothetical protein
VVFDIFPLKLPCEFFELSFQKSLIGGSGGSLRPRDGFSLLKLFRRWPIRHLMATVSPISPGAGDSGPVVPKAGPAKVAAAAVQADVTSAREDVVSLSPEAVQLIQAAGLSGYQNQELAPGTIPGAEASGTTLQLVG